MTDDELSEFIMDQFMKYDTDGSGYLDRKEFKALLTGTEMGLSKKDARRLLSEADENDDGVLEYTEFVPIMTEIVSNMRAKEVAREMKEEEEDDAREQVQYHLLHGMPREELEEMMERIFSDADADGNGTLDRKEFSKCLHSAELGLTRKEINLLLSDVDVDDDGLVSYSEFAPLCFDILVERFKDDVLAEAALESADALTMALIEEFQRKETTIGGKDEPLGKMHRNLVKQALVDLSAEFLGLSKLQITAIMSEATTIENDEVDYEIFAPSAARMIYSMVDTASQAQRVNAIAKLSNTEGAHVLHQSDRDDVRELIALAFQDADVAGRGALDRDQVYDILSDLGANSLDLKPGEINALVSAVDENEDGEVTYAELTDFLCKVLEHLSRERWIQEVAFGEHGFEEGDDGEEYADDDGSYESA